MKFNRQTRRHFLEGAGKTLLALPYLHSLMPTKALAATSAPVSFFALGTEHGGVRPQDIYGTPLSYLNVPVAGLTSTPLIPAGKDGALSYTAHNIHSGMLSNYLRTAAQSGEAHNAADPDLDNGAARLSYIVGSGFNSYLSKMNLLRGLDLHWRDMGHGQGMYLGAFHSTQNGPKPGAGEIRITPTIDTIMASSPSFYPNLSGVTLRRGILGSGRSISYDAHGAEMAFTADYTVNLFNMLFPGGGGGGGGGGTPSAKDPRVTIIEDVLDDHRRFIAPTSETGRRISAEDKFQYQQFIDHLDEIHRQLNTTSTCSVGPAPAQVRMNYNYGELPRIWQITSNIIALAFSCGACRIFTSHLDDRFLTRHSTFANYHQDVAHNHGAQYKTHRRFHRTAMDQVFLTMIKTLSTYKGFIAGTSMLDQSLLTYQPQAGYQTHNFMSNFALTAGGAADRLNTGRFIDFRSLNNDVDPAIRPGLTQNQYLATVLQATNVKRSEYENVALNKGPGYGGWAVSSKRTVTATKTGIPAAIRNQSGNPLPVWWKG